MIFVLFFAYRPTHFALEKIRATTFQINMALCCPVQNLPFYVNIAMFLPTYLLCHKFANESM